MLFDHNLRLYSFTLEKFRSVPVLSCKYQSWNIYYCWKRWATFGRNYNFLFQHLVTLSITNVVLPSWRWTIQFILHTIFFNRFPENNNHDDDANNSHNIINNIVQWRQRDRVLNGVGQVGDHVARRPRRWSHCPGRSLRRRTRMLPPQDVQQSRWVKVKQMNWAVVVAQLVRAATSYNRDPWFESSHRQTFIEHLFTVNCVEKTKIMKKGRKCPGIG